MKDTTPIIAEMRWVIYTFEVFSFKDYKHRVCLMTREK